MSAIGQRDASPFGIPFSAILGTAESVTRPETAAAREAGQVHRITSTGVM